MVNQQVAFAQGSGLIEIEPIAGESGQIRFIARLSVVEDRGAIVRPLFGGDGRRIKIMATSERLAMRAAVTYLEGMFGRALPREEPCELGASTVGAPFVTVQSR